MADSTPALLLLRWTHGQFYLVHLGVDGDVFQDETFAADDGLNKFLGLHLGAFFHGLSDNIIIVVSPVLQKACSAFSTHTNYRRA